MIPPSPGNMPIRMKLECFVGKYTTVVGTGVISQMNAIQAGLITNFATRFAMFDEYRIESFLLRVDCSSSTNPGVINVWIESNASATSLPTATDAKDNKTLTFSAGDNARTHVLSFNPRNQNTQAWTPITTTTLSCGEFKIYTDNANYASTTVATDYCVVTGTMTVAFRGFA